MKEILMWSGGVIALMLYFPLMHGIFHSTIKQSFATWMLWVLLDTIALCSVIAQKGDNYALLASYVVGGSITTLSLLYMKQFKWTWLETATVGMVFICIVVWSVSGPKWATIASTLAVCISAIPQYMDSWKSPDKHTGYIYLGYTLVNFLSFLAGKEWSVADRFYYGMMTPLCLAIAHASLQKRTNSVST